MTANANPISSTPANSNTNWNPIAYLTGYLPNINSVKSQVSSLFNSAHPFAFCLRIAVTDISATCLLNIVGLSPKTSIDYGARVALGVASLQIGIYAYNRLTNPEFVSSKIQLICKTLAKNTTVQNVGLSLLKSFTDNAPAFLSTDNAQNFLARIPLHFASPIILGLLKNDSLPDVTNSLISSEHVKKIIRTADLSSSLPIIQSLFNNQKILTLMSHESLKEIVKTANFNSLLPAVQSLLSNESLQIFAQNLVKDREIETLIKNTSLEFVTPLLEAVLQNTTLPNLMRNVITSPNSLPLIRTILTIPEIQYFINDLAYDESTLNIVNSLSNDTKLHDLIKDFEPFSRSADPADARVKIHPVLHATIKNPHLLMAVEKIVEAGLGDKHINHQIQLRVIDLLKSAAQTTQDKLGPVFASPQSLVNAFKTKDLAKDFVNFILDSINSFIIETPGEVPVSSAYVRRLHVDNTGVDRAFSSLPIIDTGNPQRNNADVGNNTESISNGFTSHTVSNEDRGALDRNTSHAQTGRSKPPLPPRLNTNSSTQSNLLMNSHNIVPNTMPIVSPSSSTASTPRANLRQPARSATAQSAVTNSNPTPPPLPERNSQGPTSLFPPVPSVVEERSNNLRDDELHGRVMTATASPNSSLSPRSVGVGSGVVRQPPTLPPRPPAVQHEAPRDANVLREFFSNFRKNFERGFELFWKFITGNTSDRFKG
ncbi:MAG: hypothetical protein V4629_10455 [Pseudomonadota bacterium]